ncbi:MAG: hypothetical protein MUQ30_03380 [Anaerolineae bacterium]|nr:hypothetical protein [Anaerolineae bacterium]
MDKDPRYLSYLMRLWQTGDKGNAIWRASLECPKSGERLSFASLEELFAFVEAQIAADRGAKGGTPEE